MDKRSIIAIALVFLILFLWPLLFSNRKKAVEKTSKSSEQQVVQKKEEKPEIKIEVKPTPKIIPSKKSESFVDIHTPLYEAKFSSDGANLVSLKLKEYPDRIDKNELMDLVPNKAKNCLKIHLHDEKMQKEIEQAQWTADKQSLDFIKTGINQGTVEFKCIIPSEIEVSKRLTFTSNSYLIDVDVSFRNLSSQPINLKGYDLSWGEGLNEDSMISPVELANDGPVVLLKTDKGAKYVQHWQKTGFGCFGGKQTRLPEEQDGPIYWVAYSGKYFTAVLIPSSDPWWSDPKQGGKRYKVVTNEGELTISPNEAWSVWGNSTTIALTKRDLTVSAGEKISHRYQAYIGPKKWSILHSINSMDSSENLKLGKMINFGAFTPFGKATLWLLQEFYKLGKNYGISIILVSILIKILYLPLTQKSFNSMNKMQELQPRFNELKEKYRDDPQRLNKETMKLYKQYGASPLGGCLPLLLQIPIFWALFSTLRGAVELRGAMFIPGWIPDLSLPDTVAVIAGIPLRILPLIMTGSTLAQQFVFGTGSPGQNNKLMAFMPVFMLFIFYGMPSGLVLYWICNDIFTFAHRYIIKLRQDKKQNEPTEEIKNGPDNKAKTKQKLIKRDKK
ncbi:TPA: membrane protein insertase YidC [Candidatus Poribacteria bacterium]|nr:membrane protein insertase YidC [Candidatus Poribacteria bacterium]